MEWRRLVAPPMAVAVLSAVVVTPARAQNLDSRVTVPVDARRTQRHFVSENMWPELLEDLGARPQAFNFEVYVSRDAPGLVTVSLRQGTHSGRYQLWRSSDGETMGITWLDSTLPPLLEWSRADGSVARVPATSVGLGIAEHALAIDPKAVTLVKLSAVVNTPTHDFLEHQLADGQPHTTAEILRTLASAPLPGQMLRHLAARGYPLGTMSIGSGTVHGLLSGRRHPVPVERGIDVNINMAQRGSMLRDAIEARIQQPRLEPPRPPSANQLIRVVNAGEELRPRATQGMAIDSIRTARGTFFPNRWGGYSPPPAPRSAFGALALGEFGVAVVGGLAEAFLFFAMLDHAQREDDRIMGEWLQGFHANPNAGYVRYPGGPGDRAFLCNMHMWDLGNRCSRCGSPCNFLGWDM